MLKLRGSSQIGIVSVNSLTPEKGAKERCENVENVYNCDKALGPAGHFYRLFFYFPVYGAFRETHRIRSLGPGFFQEFWDLQVVHKKGMKTFLAIWK